jgi:predicted small metal-binding protein
MDENDGLVEASCDPKCGFLLRTHSLDEAKRFVIDHAEKIHNMEMSEQEAEETIKPVMMMS